MMHGMYSSLLLLSSKVECCNRGELVRYGVLTARYPFMCIISQRCIQLVKETTL